MTLPAGRSVSICTKSTGHLEEAVLQVLVTLDVFWAERVNLQEKYDDPLLAAKLHEFYALNAAEDDDGSLPDEPTPARKRKKGGV